MRWAGRECEAASVLTCVIVDDSPSFLQAASTLFQREGLAVAGVASTIEEALRQTERLRPDVVLVDVMLGSESGLDLARRLAAENHGVKVILTSTHAEADLAELIANSPAIGFVPKSRLSAAEVAGLVSASRGT
jgi:DNA-binding NarL/FixJ family response regulator